MEGEEGGGTEDGGYGERFVGEEAWRYCVKSESETAKTNKLAR